MFVRCTRNVLPLIDYPCGFSVHLQIESAIDVYDPVRAMTDSYKVPVFVCRARAAVFSLVNGSAVRFDSAGDRQIQTTVHIHDSE